MTENRKTLKPADGVQVRKPNGQPLAARGETVTWNSYWLRRLQDGDVVDVKPTAKKPARKAATKTSEENQQ